MLLFGGGRRSKLERAVLAKGNLLARMRPRRTSVPRFEDPPEGIAVVIPSRNGRELLEICLPRILAEQPDQVIVVDNGSSDDTAGWLAARFSGIEVEASDIPLHFSVAVNRGLNRTGFSHVCLLNNDMEVAPGFLPALRRAFRRRQNIFCATAQIFFPEGMRREETGKAVMPPGLRPEDFPIRCIEPVDGENDTDVLYGSAGCSLYRTAWLRALGGFDESFVPAYVEDLDIGYRGWLSGGATVFVSDARVLHRHRSTTSKYFSPEDLEVATETNYLRFLARSVTDPHVFDRLWRGAVDRLAGGSSHLAASILRWAAELEPEERTIPAIIADDRILALGSGEIARFPGLDEGGVVRIVLSDELARPPLDELQAARHVVVIRNGRLAGAIVDAVREQCRRDAVQLALRA